MLSSKMAESGYAAQIVTVKDLAYNKAKTEIVNLKYEFDDHALEQILLKKEIRYLPVVVVSVAGDYRSGKSFLLNFFLRYLLASESAREDGSWLGDDEVPLTGFKWTNGAKIETRGLQMWSEPIVTTLPSGEKVAVILVDTQGTFHKDCSYNYTSAIFALSNLISSVQIYNLNGLITEEKLKFLQNCTEFAKIASNKNIKIYQEIKFLIRDWRFSFEHPYGSTAGNQVIRDILTTKPDETEKGKKLRDHIRRSFGEVSGFLMPHPGLGALKSKYNGNIADLSPEFKKQLNELITSIFSPDKLVLKKIDGDPMTARDLFVYFKNYMSIFKSIRIPCPEAIMEATTKASLFSAASMATILYENAMDLACGIATRTMPAVDVRYLHAKCLAKAQTYYNNKKKIASEEEISSCFQKLTEEIQKRQSMFLLRNRGKTQAAMKKGEESFEAEFAVFSSDESLCMHPTVFENVYRKALQVATDTFDATRIRLTNEMDEERSKFIEAFKENYVSLKRINERNNKLAVSEIVIEYLNNLNDKVTIPKFTNEELKREHEIAVNHAIEKLEQKRQGYTNDIYKDMILEKTTEYFINFLAMNKSRIRLEEMNTVN